MLVVCSFRRVYHTCGVIAMRTASVNGFRRPLVAMIMMILCALLTHDGLSHARNTAMATSVAVSAAPGSGGALPSTAGIPRAEPAGRMLFISSYHASFDTLPEQMRGLRDGLAGTGVRLDMEFMDTKRYSDPENVDNFRQFLAWRLAHGLSYDVMLLGDDNALQFFLDHPELAAGIPRVFFCVNDMERAARADGMPGYTGIVEGISIQENMAFATRLMPDATGFTAIVDGTQTGSGDRKSFLAMQPFFPGRTFSFIDTADMTFDQARTAIRNVDGDQMLFYLSMFEDSAGDTMTIDEAVRLIVDAAQVPVFRMSIGGVGQGVLGGKMVSYHEQGRMAAELGLMILSGRPVGDIGMVSESPNRYVLNWQVFQRYNLDVAAVPADVEWIGRPVGILQQYRSLLVPLLLALGVMLLVLGIVLWDNHRQRLMRRQIAANRDALSALYEELTATEEELRENYNQLEASRNELLASEERFRVLALSDPLTGLKNRLALSEAMSARFAAGGDAGAIFFIDLDNFKYVNDMVGHQQGDRVLVQIGGRLRQLEHKGALVSRLGGDEFVVALFEAGMSVTAARCLADEIIGMIREPVFTGTQDEYRLTCSLGVVCFDRERSDVMNLLRMADIAMYRAKEQGRNRMVLYVADMEAELATLLEMQGRIHQALEHEEFRLWYQPQIHWQSGEIWGVECLIRWQSPDHGLIAPDRFIPMAERLGLIAGIGMWVQREACRFAGVWRTRMNAGSASRVALNVSAAEIARHDFVEQLLASMDRFGVEPQWLAVEITESVFMENLEDSVVKLTRLRAEGIEIHLDDFGSGYSSLTYLIKLPIDVVKLDRHFIRDVCDNEALRRLVRSVVDLVHNVGKRLVVEGVETEATAALLGDMGCDGFQGYLYSRPLPEEALWRYLSDGDAHGGG